MKKLCLKILLLARLRMREKQGIEFIKRQDYILLNDIWPSCLVANLAFWCYRIVRFFIILVYSLSTFNDVSKSPFPYLFDFLILPLPQIFNKIVLPFLSPHQKSIALNLFIFTYSLIINYYFSQKYLMSGSIAQTQCFTNLFIVVLMLQSNLYLHFSLLRLLNQLFTLVIILFSEEKYSILDNLEMLIILFIFINSFQWQWDTCFIKIINYKQFQKNYLANLPITLCILSQTASKVLYVNKQIKKLTKVDLATSTQYLGSKREKVFSSKNQKDEIFNFFSSIFVDIDDARSQIPSMENNFQIQLDENNLVDLAQLIQLIGNQIESFDKVYCFKSVQIFKKVKLSQSGNLFSNEKKFLDVRVQTGLNFGEDRSIIVTLYDTSSHLKYLYFQNLNQVKSKLIKSISHELRTRLNIIQGMISILINSKLQIDSKYQQMLQITYNNCLIQTYIIGGIIDYNLIEENQMIFEKVKCTLKKQIIEAISLFQDEAEMKEIQISSSISIQNEKLHYCDASRIMICLVNLISNSIKFTPKGGRILVSLSESPFMLSPLLKKGLRSEISNKSNLRQQSQLFQKLSLNSDKYSSSQKSGLQLINFQSNKSKHNMVFEQYIISVSDTGIGISSKKLKKINLAIKGLDIDLENDGTDQAEGFMMGVRVMARIINKLNEEPGEWLKYESTENEGTIAKFTLKTQMSHNNFSNSFQQQQYNDQNLNINVLDSVEIEDNINKTNQFGKTNLFPNLRIDLQQEISDGGKEVCECEQEILIVDDEPFNIFILEQFFKEQNQRTIKADNGKLCVELVKKRLEMSKRYNHKCHLFMAILMDYQMPLMNGAEAAKQINRLLVGQLKENQRFPIIGCTGFSSQQDVQVLLDSGMNEVLTKPITKRMIEDLLKRIKDSGIMLPQPGDNINL